MRILAFLTEPPVVRSILLHIELPPPSPLRLASSTSAVPVLMVSGELDMNTPPEQAGGLRRWFPAGAHVLVRYAGHGDAVGADRIPEIVADFVEGATVGDTLLSLEPPG